MPMQLISSRIKSRLVCSALVATIGFPATMGDHPATLLPTSTVPRRFTRRVVIPGKNTGPRQHLNAAQKYDINTKFPTLLSKSNHLMHNVTYDENSQSYHGPTGLTHVLTIYWSVPLFLTWRLFNSGHQIGKQRFLTEQFYEHGIVQVEGHA